MATQKEINDTYQALNDMYNLCRYTDAVPVAFLYHCPECRQTYYNEVCVHLREKIRQNDSTESAKKLESDTKEN